MDDCDFETKWDTLVENFDKPIKNSPARVIPAHDFTCQRDVISQRHRNRMMKQLELISEKKLIIKNHSQLSCELGPAPRSTFLMVFSPNGQIVASTHGDHNIYVSDIKSGSCLHTLRGHPRSPWCISFHPSSNDLIASGCLGGEVRIWDLKGSSEVWVSEEKNQIASLAFHPRDSVLAIATDNKIYFWNWTLKDPFTFINTKSAKEKVKYVKFDPLGNKLITGITNIKLVAKNKSWLPNTVSQPSNFFGDENSSMPDSAGRSNLTGFVRRGRPHSLFSYPRRREDLQSDVTSDNSYRVEDAVQSNNQLDENSSSSSRDSSSSASSATMAFRQIGQLSSALFWESQRERAEAESDDSTASLDLNDNGIHPTAEYYANFAELRRRAAINDGVERLSYPLADSPPPLVASPLPSAPLPPVASLTSRRSSSRSSRTARPTGFHSPPPFFLGDNFLDMPINLTRHDRSGQTASSNIPGPTPRNRYSDALDPLHGISLLSGHIENMQRICGSLDLARQNNSSVHDEHREISRLGQIRSMLIDIQTEIQSLRTAVDEAGEISLQTGEPPSSQQRSEPSTSQPRSEPTTSHHLGEPTTSHQLGDPSTSQQWGQPSNLQQTNEPSELLQRCELSTSPRWSVYSNALRTDELLISLRTDELLTSLRTDEPLTSLQTGEPSTSQQGGEPSTSLLRDAPSTSLLREGPFTSVRRDVPSTSDLNEQAWRSAIQHHNYCTTSNNSEDMHNSSITSRLESRIRRTRNQLSDSLRRIRQRRSEREGQRAIRRLEHRQRAPSPTTLQRRLQHHARPTSRRNSPNTGGRLINGRPLDPNEVDRDFYAALTSRLVRATTPRQRAFSWTSEVNGISPPSSSNNESIPDQRPNRLLNWQQFARFRRLRNIGRADRYSTTLSQRISTMLREQENRLSSLGVAMERQMSYEEELNRLQSFREVMHRLLEFVNDLGTEMVNSRVLAQATLNDIQGHPNEVDLEAIRFRGNFREAYRLTLRSLILRIHRFIDTYLSENTAEMRQRSSNNRMPAANENDTLPASERRVHLHLLVRLALLLIYQLINFLSTQNILNEERLISRLPNPFREMDGASSRPRTNDSAGETLSSLSLDLGSLLEFVELTTDSLIAEANRSSSASTFNDYRYGLSNLAGRASSPSTSNRLASVPRAQRLDPRRLSTIRMRARSLLRSPFYSSASRMTENPAASGEAPRAFSPTEMPSLVDETLDVNSNYVGGALSGADRGFIPLPQQSDAHLRTFGGVPLRVLGRQNAFDRRSPDLEQPVPPIPMEEPIANANPEVPTESRRNRHSLASRAREFRDEFMFHRQSSSQMYQAWSWGSSDRYQHEGEPRSSNVLNQPMFSSIVSISNRLNTHRLQVWDFNITNLPDIGDRKRNILLGKCKIHFDASVEISADGTMLVALVPKLIEYCSMVICSLVKDNLGEILYCHTVESNSICVSMSPTMAHIVVGVGSFTNRVGILQDHKQVVAYIYKLNESKRILHLQRGIELRTDQRLISLNCIKWLPVAGTGFIYGTNKGQLTILQ